MADSEIKDKDFLTTLARGLSVIRSFQKNRMTMTLSETAEANDMSRASARRFLLTLQTLGYVKVEGRQFSLTPKVLELGYSYLANLDVGGVVSSQLEQVTQQIHQSSSAAVLDGTDIVYIARVPVRSLLAFNLQIGARLPAYATSMGRVLLSQLPEQKVISILEGSNIESLTPYTLTSQADILRELEIVKQQGYSINDQELELGLRSVAVPVVNQKGQVKLTLNISTHVSQVSSEDIVSTFVPILKQASAQISASLP
ncbi:pca regulon regulatory protein pcaR [Vibrio ishigakensis]|uniref:Pca regulon regulatory protein pcaR n=1 Tax=Vibrio ishigakensis TaxID=1481914 RepID=A0A0B8PIB5_9VIBR|nr:pca regulon regulatory protein pcaR [Vibrio ishigakensis]